MKEPPVLSLKKKSAVLALAAGLTLSLAACGSDEADDTAKSEDSQSTEVSKDPVAKIDALTGKQTAVTLDAGFVEGITGLGLAPGVLGGAKFDGMAGVVSFPITGGNVTYYDPKSGVNPYVQGRIEHFKSGLTLTKGDTQVALTDFVVDPGASVLMGKVAVNGKAFPAPDTEVPLFFLDGSTLNPLEVDMASSTGVLEGTTVSLTKEAAGALNMVFKTDALAEFFKVGIAEITVDVPKS
jgi:hypothetical protein